MGYGLSALAASHLLAQLAGPAIGFPREPGTSPGNGKRPSCSIKAGAGQKLIPGSISDPADRSDVERS
jgi:hypothetical protein